MMVLMSSGVPPWLSSAAWIDGNELPNSCSFQARSASSRRLTGADVDTPPSDGSASTLTFSAVMAVCGAMTSGAAAAVSSVAAVLAAAAALAETAAPGSTGAASTAGPGAGKSAAGVARVAAAAPSGVAGAWAAAALVGAKASAASSVSSMPAVVGLAGCTGSAPCGSAAGAPSGACSPAPLAPDSARVVKSRSSSSANTSSEGGLTGVTPPMTAAREANQSSLPGSGSGAVVVCAPLLGSGIAGGGLASPTDSGTARAVPSVAISASAGATACVATDSASVTTAAAFESFWAGDTGGVAAAGSSNGEAAGASAAWARASASLSSAGVSQVSSTPAVLVPGGATVRQMRAPPVSTSNAEPQAPHSMRSGAVSWC